MTPENVAELKRLLERATQGPWVSVDGIEIWDVRGDGELGVPLFRQSPKGGRIWGRWIDDGELEASAALIVAAINALPALLSAKADRNREMADMCEAALAPGNGDGGGR